MRRKSLAISEIAESCWTLVTDTLAWRVTLRTMRLDPFLGTAVCVAADAAVPGEGTVGTGIERRHFVELSALCRRGRSPDQFLFSLELKVSAEIKSLLSGRRRLAASQ